MLQTRNLTFQYKKTDAMLRFPDINLEPQENLLILGKSGVGKTTLLHLLAGILKPSSGHVIINEEDISSLSHRKLDQFRGQNIGLVFQKKHAITSLNVLENLQTRLYCSKKAID
ncbi:MAG: ATP-binding cassette domain-containing protein, partial [Tetragenococcus halophilus]|nr:ATP-binding cassette domain-containing protein [Tetragenococcus halophilus]